LWFETQKNVVQHCLQLGGLIYSVAFFKISFPASANLLWTEQSFDFNFQSSPSAKLSRFQKFGFGFGFGFQSGAAEFL
jgi:hypothetical protein